MAKQWNVLTAVLLMLVLVQAQANPLSSDYTAKPPLLNESSEPLVMLVMSVDHELFKKAYSDYTDLDGDGKLDTTYNDAFDYLGYFDSSWCYKYDSGRFQPEALATGTNLHFCETSAAPWSGNFLNWATMSRADILRRVLFGGKRSTDSSTQTILERAYLPRDVHAFAKVYSGDDTAKLTPYSKNEVSLCNVAESENGAPLLRVAENSASGQTGWPRWASTELRQCQWSSSDSNSPSSGSDKLDELYVRVESCVSGKDATSLDRCKEYPNQNSKPVGLLQKYGEDGAIRFGLISGSYDKNISGGILRRNIGKIAGNSSSSNDEIDLNTGSFSSVKGIIHNINTFRIAKYSFSQTKYTDCNSFGISVSSFKSNRGTTSGRHCSMWGNPLGEIYLEALRYFAGETSPTSAFDTTQDSQFVSDLTRETWADPLSSENACANCSIILLSTGLNSFDSDQLSTSSGLPGLSGSNSVDTFTDDVGEMEYGGSFAGNYLIGNNGSNTDKGKCTGKYLTGLSEALGLCPEIPQLEGGYQISGLSLYSNTTDLRASFDGLQNVRTYAIELAESMPSFTFDVDGKEVTFQPVCEAHSGRTNCSLTDVKIEVDPGEYNNQKGKFEFFWEDSLWGNDYDYDASSSIEFCIGNTCNPDLSSNQIKITVKQEYKNAGAGMWFSYVVTGTENDRVQSYVTGNNQSAGAPDATTFTVLGSRAQNLPKPMFLAAKYGGFIDLDRDGTPRHDADGDGSPDEGDSREWDNRNNATGVVGSDGVPDNYFFSRNPSLLEAQLDQVLSDISSRVTSATNAALFSNSSNGTGVVYQALFQPSRELNGTTVTWGGILHALFIDNRGHLREDSNDNDQLDDYSTDKIVELIFDPNAGQTKVQRYNSSDNGITKTATGALASLNSLDTLWDARKQLSQVSNVTSQRSFGAIASGGRHILTWLDQDNNQQVDAGELLSFTSGTFTGNEGYLGVGSSDAGNVVNYIRGEEQASARSRTIDFDENGTTDTWRLGDIIHSTPRLVAAPDSRFDARYNDASYQTFRNQYINRRHVLYVGANDGLIHAFNGGFWNESDYSYERTNGSGAVQHPLGSEIWAYAPMNLLPHLQWLREADYPHVYYMDGEPLVFDANIFTEDDDHPGGWGTVLIMGMRLGGGNIDVTIDGSTRTMRSAYVVLDITNPEKAPQLLAEITHENLGFTTSQPELIKFRRPGTDSDGADDWSSPAKNEWYLAFGSGPGGSSSNAIRDALEEGKSGQNLQLFVYDLKNKTFVSGLDPLVTSYSNSYAGDIAVADWDQDYHDDAVYFGTVDTASSTLGGRMMRLKLNSTLATSSLGVFLESGKPMTTKPLTVADQNSYWVYAGSGRLLTSSDNRDISANYFYGVQEPLNSANEFTYATVDADNLIDTTDVEVLDDGTVRTLVNGSYEGFPVGESTISDFESLKVAIKGQPGWKVALSYDGVNPSGRNVNKATQLYSAILFTEYQPPADSCSVDGNSYLYALHYLTGTASTETVLGTLPIPDLDAELALNKVSLGLGYASSPVIHKGSNGKLGAITQGAGGSIANTELQYGFSSEGRQSWRQIFNIP